jgi:hypothetical protein
VHCPWVFSQNVVYAINGIVSLPLCYICEDNVGRGDFQKFPYGSETFHMTSEALRDMLEGDFADTIFTNVYGRPAECQACKDTEMRGIF